MFEYFAVRLARFLARSGAMALEETLPTVIVFLGPTKVGKTQTQDSIFVQGDKLPIPEAARTTEMTPWESTQISYITNRDIIRRTIKTCDVPGHEQLPDGRIRYYHHHMWLQAVLEYRAPIVCFEIDGRHLEDPNRLHEHLEGLQFMVDFLVQPASTEMTRRQKKKALGSWTRRKLLSASAVRYKPRLFMLVANKFDLWGGSTGSYEKDLEYAATGDLYQPFFCSAPGCGAGPDEACDHGQQYRSYHPIFKPFVPYLQRLSSREVGISTMKWAWSALTGYNMERGLIEAISRI